MSQRGSLRLGLVVCAVLLAHTTVAALTPAPAVAEQAHAFSFAFGGAGTVQGEAGSLSLASSQKQIYGEPGSGLAVNVTTHDVYVADTGNRRIDEFHVDEATHSATFLRAWGWGVATGAAELQVCTSSCRTGLSGSEPGEFETPSFVAVDNSSSASKGDVYVGDTGDQLVTKFDPEGHLISSWGNNGENAKKERTEPNGQLNGSPTETFNGSFPTATLGGIAVDGSGHLLVIDSRLTMFEFDQSGHWLLTCTPTTFQQPRGIAVDEACVGEKCGFDFIGGFGKVVQDTEACKAAGEGASLLVGDQPAPEEPKGLAVDSATGDLFVDGSGERVEDIPAACKPSNAGCQPTQVFGEEPAGGANAPPPPIAGATGVAVDPASGTVYIANTATEQIAAFTVVIEAASPSVTNVTPHSALLHATVNPEGVELTRCRFEYERVETGKTPTFSYGVPCEQSRESIGHGTAPVPVSAKIEGLESSASYVSRLDVTSPKGAIESETGQFQTTSTAVIKEVVATEVTASSAVLHAIVNPEGLAAHYHFESSICNSASGCASSPFNETIVPVPDADIPAGTANVPISQRIEGLHAGSTYHFRLVITDANGIVTLSPEETFVVEPQPPGCSSSRPGADSLLGDCRGYEMVTPPGKNGALIDNGAFLTEPSIAPDGSRVISKSIQCFHEPESCIGIRQTEGEPYAFERTESGWQTTPLAPPVSAGATALTYDAESDVVLYSLAASPPAREQLYSRTPDGVLHAIGPIQESPGLAVERVADRPLVATSDLSRVVYGSRGQWPSLEAGSPPGTENALEYRGTGNSAPELVAVTGPAGSTSLISACGSVIGASNDYGALSSDGRTVFFTVESCAHGTGANAAIPVPAHRVYARIEQAGGMRTVLVSGPGGAAECNASCQAQPAGDAVYRGASSDGSRVYFTSTQQLTDAASEDKRAGDSALVGCSETSSAATGCNLYEFECPNHCESLSERHLVDASAGDMSGLGPQVQGVVGVPPDGSDVYFVARGVLSKANASGQEPSPGGLNLYVHLTGTGGSAGQTHFIATLSPSDAGEWTNPAVDLGRANVSPEGRYLVLTSHKSLTPDVTRPEGPAQVYRYDAQTEALTRVSVGNNGFNDNGNAFPGLEPGSTTSLFDAGIVPAIDGFQLGVGPGNVNPTMSDNGQLVFFESPTALAAGALDDQVVTGSPTGNRKVLAQNVYEWAADGAQPSINAPRCGQPEGCVSLISDGKDVTEGSGAHFNQSAVQLLGTDATGENVFFWTADQLVPGDTDSQVDLYDARVGGGFAERAAPPACEPGLTLSGGVCRSAGSAPGLFGGPVSVTFSGPGNVIGEPGPVGRPTPRGLTTVQKLKRALAACRGRYRSRRSRGKRAVCERRARQRYRTKTTTGSTGPRRKVGSRGRTGR